MGFVLTKDASICLGIIPIFVKVGWTSLMAVCSRLGEKNFAENHTGKAIF